MVLQWDTWTEIIQSIFCIIRQHLCFKWLKSVFRLVDQGHKLLIHHIESGTLHWKPTFWDWLNVFLNHFFLQCTLWFMYVAFLYAQFYDCLGLFIAQIVYRCHQLITGPIWGQYNRYQSSLVSGACIWSIGGKLAPLDYASTDRSRSGITKSTKVVKLSAMEVPG